MSKKLNLEVLKVILKENKNKTGKNEKLTRQTKLAKGQSSNTIKQKQMIKQTILSNFC